MEHGQIVDVSLAAFGAAWSTLLLLRAQWFAQRAYRSWYWRGSSVDQVTSHMQVMGWTGLIVSVVYGVLALVGIETPSLR